jgi:alpha-L-fucosidase
MRLRAISALAVAVIAAVLMPAAQAHAAGPYPPGPCPGQISVSTTNPLPGETITVTGSGFAPGSSVHLTLHTKVYDLGTFTANAQGSFTAHVTLPAGVYGKHFVIGTTAFTKDCPGDPVQIQSPGGESTGPGGPPGTSFTGTDLMMILVAAGVLIGAGALFMRGGKRRTAEHV